MLAAVDVMLIVLALIRRDRRALFLALGMSASGLAIGATGGFVAAALLSGRWLAAALALNGRWSARPSSGCSEESFTIAVSRPNRSVRSMSDMATLTEKEREEFSRHMAAQWERNMEEINSDLARLGRKTNSLLVLAAGTMLAGILMIWLVNRR